MQGVRVLVAVAGGAALLAAAGPAPARDWPQPNGNLRGTRSTQETPITSRTVAGLRVRWRFALPRSAAFGAFASTPLVEGGTVYVQDLTSSVFAIDAATGAPRWEERFRAPTDGPNGLALAGRRLFGATDTTVFALDKRTGKRLWTRRLVNREEQFVDIAPLAAHGLVYTSTVGFSPGGRGRLYALDARSGAIRWRFDTIRDPWQFRRAGGGGAWYTPSLASDGTLYVGVSNPQPWGGTPARPNGGMYPGPVPYTDAILALRARAGTLRWFDQVTKHDVRDYDFETSPIVVGNVVFGAGKGGRVVAWNRSTGKRLWANAVGTHLHDLGPLPRKPTLVCPGLWGGVLTPMSYANGRLFVPVVERCMKESAIRSVFPADLTTGDGVVTAMAATTGRKLWTQRLGSPATGCTTVASDVVFAPTLDGRVYAFRAKDGALLWKTQARAGINGCPSVAGGLLVVGAGAPLPDRPGAPELVAYDLGG